MSEMDTFRVQYWMISVRHTSQSGVFLLTRGSLKKTSRHAEKLHFDTKLFFDKISEFGG